MKTLNIAVCTLIFLGIWLALPAQSNRDEYDVLKRFEIPESAVMMSNLTQVDSVFLQGGAPYTGFAYELYANRKHLRMITLLKGVQHGPMYLWYPDGSPQMSANYHQGRLHGRFLGWYQTGGVIYDMVINHGGFSGDYLYDADGSRESTDTPESEGEAVDND
ncbi:MAG: hypothetical protein U1B83_03525 [Candidatus Cloacimonadaceae bacterium]|nr:hypothetical protein [Candidatus Cloacimonadaceae bacterium]